MTKALVQDLLPEILKRLPVKSLLRFKCVEKSWYHLIKSSYFVNLYSHHQKYSKHKYLLIQDRFHSHVSLRIDDKQCTECYSQLQLPVPDNLTFIYGTCRGLICYTSSDSNVPWLCQVYLWNPSIRISKTLPDTAIPCDDPVSGPLTMGIAFGFFPDINDYKVFKIEKYNYNWSGEVKSKLYVSIYSLSTNSWRTVSKDKFTTFSNYALHNSVVINGIAYWVGIDYLLVQGGRIVCYDKKNETIREIMLPPQYSMQLLYNVDLVEHSGKLVPYVIVYRNAESLDMLVLENQGEVDEVWTRKATLDFENDVSCWPIGFRNSGEVVLSYYELGKCKNFSYDHEKEEATEMVDDASNLWSGPCFDPYLDGIHVPPSDIFQPIYVNSFEESLVLLG